MCNQKRSKIGVLAAGMRRLVVGLATVMVAAMGSGAAADETPQDQRQTWTVAVIADLNGPYGSKDYNEHVEAAVAWIRDDLQPDLVVSAGDMVAGQREGLPYAGMWEAFHEVVTDEFAEAGIPMAVTPGNHDASEQPRFWPERIEFARQWKLRRPQLSFVDDSFYPFYYAFEFGPALFVSLDGTGIGDLDDAQLNWIDEVLDTNAHLEVSVLFSHVPQYPVAEGRRIEIFDDDRLATLMRDHEVDMMISGHHHAYYPARRHGTYLLHAHCLGSGARPLLGEDSARPRNVAVFDISADGIESIRAFESPHFDEVVDHEKLPESLGQPDTKLWRMDRGDDRESERSEGSAEE